MGNLLDSINLDNTPESPIVHGSDTSIAGFTFFGLNEKEQSALHDMLLSYKEMQEEIYDLPPSYDMTTLFTGTQLELFRVFGVIEQEEEEAACQS